MKNEYLVCLCEGEKGLSACGCVWVCVLVGRGIVQVFVCVFIYFFLPVQNIPYKLL